MIVLQAVSPRAMWAAFKWRSDGDCCTKDSYQSPNQRRIDPIHATPTHPIHPTHHYSASLEVRPRSSLRGLISSLSSASRGARCTVEAISKAEACAQRIGSMSFFTKQLISVSSNACVAARTTCSAACVIGSAPERVRQSSKSNAPALHCRFASPVTSSSSGFPSRDLCLLRSHLSPRIILVGIRAPLSSSSR